MAGPFTALIPAALALLALILGVFGGLSYKFYESPNTWLGLVLFVAIFGVFAFFVSSLKRFFQRHTGRLVFALWVIAILGAYFAHLISVPEVKKDQNGVAYKDKDGNPIIERRNEYPMGNDLAGGTELIYVLNYDQIDNNIRTTKELADKARKEDPNGKKARELDSQVEALERAKATAPDKAAEVVRHRIDPNGTKGIAVVTFGSNRDHLRIQLPRATEAEVQRIETAIATQGRLNFHIASDSREIQDETAKSQRKDSHGFPLYRDEKEGKEYVQMSIKTPKKFSSKKDDYNEEKIVVDRIPGMDGSHITLALAKIGQDGRWEIEVRFDAAGSADFALLTEKNIKKRMAIVLDNEAKSAPTIQTRIEGVCQITGNFTKEEAEKLASVLTAGSLPAEVKQENKYFVGPSLGEEQIRSGVLATVIATVVVILFMLAYYRLAGTIAALCMLLNLPMLLGMMGFFKATLTLPGIAGIVLTLGMAVDANVLIIERLREELARGRTFKQAVAHGFDRAFLTIIDCHMTTLISSVVLYYLGTGPVRGFAVSLSLGILTTLFCNLWLNWIIMEWMANREVILGLNLMQFFKETHIDFMGARRLWMAITGAAAAISLCLFVYFSFLSKDKNRIYDVDFTGGTRVQFNFAKGKAKKDEELKKAVKEKVQPELGKSVDAVIAAMKKHVTEKEADLAKSLAAEGVPGAEALAKEASGKQKGLSEIVENLEKDNKLIKEGDELTAQSFGRPESDNTNSYRSFTLTTRIVNNVIAAELNKVLREQFKGELEPEAVERTAPDYITLRMADPKLSKDDINARLKEAMGKLSTDPLFSDIAAQLNGLNVDSVEVKEGEGYVEAKVKGFPAIAEGPDKKPLPADVERVERLKQAVTLAGINDRIGGPISSSNAFGAQVASETGWFSLGALLIANLAVFVYLWFRFEFSGAWGFGAIVALLHDVVIAAGAVIVAHLLGFPILINLNIVAALLTITGFSVNDTIVVFDRIREVKAAHPTRSYEDIVNEAINATLSRTILTSLTVILSVVSLLIFGGPTIKDMAFTLLIGFMVGTYSSIFIASPLMIWWYKRFGTGRAPVPTKRPDTTDVAATGQI